MLLTITQAAEQLGLSRQRVQSLIDSKRIPAADVSRVGAKYRAWRIPARIVEQFAACEPIEPHPSAQKPTRRRKPKPTDDPHGLRARYEANLKKQGARQ